MKSNKTTQIILTLCLISLLSVACTKEIITNPETGGGEPGKSKFLHAKGQTIVDANNNEIILRGVGLGGWFLQEGYMLGTSGPQHEIRTFLEGVAGKEATDEFYADWLKYFVTQKDIAQIKSWGYNSVRIPLHYNMFFDDGNKWVETNNQGFKYLDDLLLWCKASSLYLILDLHAAPGGQGGVKDICDGREGQSLWENPLYQDMTVLFWYKMAERYAKEEWIGGYDLFNEPNYDFENTGSAKGCKCKQNLPLLVLHQRMIDTIRIVDKNHLLIMEGNCMGSNYAGMDSLATYDKKKNVAFSFHHYWVENSLAAIQDELNLRERLNVPLWRGEIGENSNTWFTDMVKLMDQTRIGWANWPWKKINTLDGPVIIEPIPLWNKLITYKSDRSKPAPTTAEAQEALKQMIENIKIDNCRLMHDVAYAYINLPVGAASKPFAKHTIPGFIHMSDYDMGEYNKAWNDATYQNTSGSSTNSWNRGMAYRNDGVDIWKTTTDTAPANGYFIGEIKAGEWLQFTLDSVEPGNYTISARVRTKGSGILSVYMGDTKISTINFSSPDNVWMNAEVKNIPISNAGSLKVAFDKDGFDVSYLHFVKE